MFRMLSVLLSAALLWSGCASTRVGLAPRVQRELSTGHAERAYQKYLESLGSVAQVTELFNLGVLALEAGHSEASARILGKAEPGFYDLARPGTGVVRPLVHYYRSLAFLASGDTESVADETLALHADLAINRELVIDPQPEDSFFTRVDAAIQGMLSGDSTLLADAGRVVIFCEAGFGPALTGGRGFARCAEMSSAPTAIRRISVRVDDADGLIAAPLAEDVLAAVNHSARTAQTLISEAYSQSLLRPSTPEPEAESPTVDNPYVAPGEVMWVDAWSGTGKDHKPEHSTPPAKREGRREHPESSATKSTKSKSAPSPTTKNPPPEKHKPTREDSSKAKSESETSDDGVGSVVGTIIGTVLFYAVVGVIYLAIKAIIDHKSGPPEDTPLAVLPDRIFAAELTLPPGEHQITALYESADGRTMARYDFAPCRVVAGHTTILRARCMQ